MAKAIFIYLQADRHGRYMGLQSQSGGDGLASCDSHFETARLGVFATPGSPQALAMPDIHVRNPGFML
ncbi:MAG TPA: hypothetical protein VE131_11250 [Terriglobales bacterium]|nr:hypothetical protein [Terriglobales bacterium]